MNRELNSVLPLLGIEQDCILSKGGDTTLVFEVRLPELFTLSNDDYESLHHAFIKALRVLPKYTVYHQQDWFVEDRYTASFNEENTFFARSSEKFFNERPFLSYHCYIMLTRKPDGKQPASSLFSTLLRKSILPKGANHPGRLQEFFDAAGQFARILSDSGYVSLKRLTGKEMASTERKTGISEQYCFLSTGARLSLRDIHLRDELKIGDKHCLLYSLNDVADLPSLCGPRISYDRYSTDKSKHSTGFASGLGQLLSCSHIYNQYIFIEDAQQTMRRLESKRLRLQSLSGYSRENAIAKEAVNDYLNEAIGSGKQPVKAHFNI